MVGSYSFSIHDVFQVFEFVKADVVFFGVQLNFGLAKTTEDFFPVSQVVGEDYASNDYIVQVDKDVRFQL